MWRISKEVGQPLHTSIINIAVSDYPYTLTYVLRRRIQIDGYNELSKEQRPPKSIWDSPSELEDWFDRIFSRGEKQTEFNLPDSGEVE